MKQARTPSQRKRLQNEAIVKIGLALVELMPLVGWVARNHGDPLIRGGARIAIKGCAILAAEAATVNL